MPRKVEVRCCPKRATKNWGPGWFVNEETGRVERCDECKKYAHDESAARAARKAWFRLMYAGRLGWPIRLRGKRSKHATR